MFPNSVSKFNCQTTVFRVDGINHVLYYIIQYMFAVISHAEEMNYLVIVDGVNQTTTDNSNEDITRKRMVRMWTNFVKYG